MLVTLKRVTLENFSVPRVRRNQETKKSNERRKNARAHNRTTAEKKMQKYWPCDCFAITVGHSINTESVTTRGPLGVAMARSVHGKTKKGKSNLIHFFVVRPSVRPSAKTILKTRPKQKTHTHKYEKNWNCAVVMGYAKKKCAHHDTKFQHFFVNCSFDFVPDLRWQIETVQVRRHAQTSPPMFRDPKSSQSVCACYFCRLHWYMYGPWRRYRPPFSSFQWFELRRVRLPNEISIRYHFLNFLGGIGFFFLNRCGFDVFVWLFRSGCVCIAYIPTFFHCIAKE